MNSGRPWFRISALVLGFMFLYIPILSLIAYSFNKSKLVTVWGGFSTHWYGALLKNDQILKAAWLSVRIGMVSATLAVILGTLCGLALTRFGPFKGRTLLSGMKSAPLVMPEVITGLSMLLLFVTMEQLIGWPAGRGITTIIIAHVTFTMAFVTVIVQSRLVQLDESIEEAAADLGARPAKVFFVITLPYTWFGGGGSVGNRYFVGAYGAFLFLLPPIAQTGWALVPWLIGGVFTAQLVLNPFSTSFRPGQYASHGPLRLLPVELTNVNDLPINTNPSRVRVAFGENPDLHDPPFQIYFLDDNAYEREPDRSFWVRGESRAEFLIKTDRTVRMATMRLEGGPVATDVVVNIGGKTERLHLTPGETQHVSLALGSGFPYMGRLVWTASVSSSAGFSPVFYGGTDARYLGVRVRPVLVP